MRALLRTFQLQRQASKIFCFHGQRITVK
jgi:hypothetical protein